MCAEQTTNPNKDQSEQKIYKLYEYLRVSTKLQDTEMQKETNRRFTKGRPFEIIKTFEDKAMSGVLGLERPAFKQMYDEIESNKCEADGILTYAWDRISREEEFAITFMYLLRKHNKFVVESSTGLKLDFDQMHNRLITMLNSVISADERPKTKRRQRDGIQTYKTIHGRWGPFKKFGVSAETGRAYNEDMFWKKYELYRSANISKSSIARILQITRTTLYERFKENPKKYNEIESKIKLKK